MIPGITAGYPAAGGGAGGDGLNDVAAPSPVAAMAFWNLFPSSYSGDCLRIERVSDNATQEIGFDGSGVCDFAAIAAFCGASNGRIHTWYNQIDGSSGIFGTTAGQRPVIYNGSTGEMVVDSSGKVGWAMGSVIPEFSHVAGSVNLCFMARYETSDTYACAAGNRASNNFYMGLGQSGSSAASVHFGSGSSGAGTNYKNGALASVATRGQQYTEFNTGSPNRWCGIFSSTTAYNFTLGVYDGSTGGTVSMNSGFFTGYALKYTSALTAGEVAAIDAYLAANIPDG